MAGYVTTGMDNAYQPVEIPTVNGPTVSDVTIVVSLDPLQEILGFGGAFTQATAVNFNRLSADNQSKFVEL